MIQCKECNRPYPTNGLPYLCEKCGGGFEVQGILPFDLSQVEEGQPGIWKYRHAFLNPSAPVLTLGEGSTPLVQVDDAGSLFAKPEYLNPTGSYKDRVMPLIVSEVLARGGAHAIEDSSGNAGAAFAAYAARAGIGAKVFVPAYTEQAKIDQIECFGAKAVLIDGPRQAASEAVRQEAEKGSWYASHAYLPFGLGGIATIAYELFEQMDHTMPGTVITPVGHGHLLRGVIEGFLALLHKGYVESLPYFVGVQPESCAPVARAWSEQAAVYQKITPEETVAQGASVSDPRQGNNLLQMVKKHGGEFVMADETSIMDGFSNLARKGFFVEPTSALVWAGYEKLKDSLKPPVVLILTGSGLKYTIKH
jgi:threonine synthase